MASLKLQQLRKVYDNGHVAVDGFSLEVAEGELVVLVGPSGCGKSTTLRMIAGLEKVTEGTLHLGDRKANDLPPRERDVAMVFQNYALYPHMSVFENMALGLRLRRYSREDIEERVTQTAELLGIHSLVSWMPGQLSGGQRQRVALGRAMVRKPGLFLFDEPLSNLDAALRVKMRAEIARLHRRLQATTVYVTHDQEEALSLADRIIVMDSGRIQQIDTPEKIYAKPRNRFVAGFMGSPAMNFIAGSIAKGPGGPTFRSWGNDVVVPLPETLTAEMPMRTDEPVWLGVRPEHVSLSHARSDSPAIHAHLPVDLIETAGNTCFVYLRRPDEAVIARVDPQVHLIAGEMVDVALDPHQLHFFDMETSEAFFHSRGEAMPGPIHQSPA